MNSQMAEWGRPRRPSRDLRLNLPRHINRTYYDTSFGVMTMTT